MDERKIRRHMVLIDTMVNARAHAQNAHNAITRSAEHVDVDVSIMDKAFEDYKKCIHKQILAIEDAISGR